MKKLLFIIAVFNFSLMLKAQTCGDLFISEYVEGTGNNKALEIYNPTSNPISLSNYRIVRYDNGNNYSEPIPPESVMDLPVNIVMPPHSVYVIALNLTDPNGTGQSAPIDLELQAVADTLLCPGCATGTGLPRVMCFNGDDALALQKKSGTSWNNVDIFGCIGERPSNSQGLFSPTGGWTIIPPYSSMPSDYPNPGAYFLEYWSQDKTLLRKFGVQTGVNVNPAPQTFNPSVQWDSLPTNTYVELGRHACACGCTEFANAEVTINANALSTCIGNTVTATATAIGIEGDNQLSYTWSNGATGSSVQLPIGTHQVIISRADGCSTSKTITITESTPPSVQPAISAPTGCGAQDGSITLTISGSTGPYQVSWSNGDEGLIVDSLAAGNYSYALQDASSCLYTSVISISDPGAPSITLTNSVIASCDTCQDGSIDVTVSAGAEATYTWTLNGDTVANTQDLTNIGGGTYFLTVLENGCVASFSTFIGIATGLKELKSTSWLSLFPNPAQNQITFKSEKGIAYLEIIDLNGKIVSLNKPNNVNILTEDIQAYKPGIYFAKVIDTDNRISVKRFIKN